MYGIIVLAAYLLIEHLIDAIHSAYQAHLQAELERLKVEREDSSIDGEKEPEEEKKIGFIQYGKDRVELEEE